MIKLAKLWKNKSLSTATKLCLMKTLVWPVATYVCDWELHPGFWEQMHKETATHTMNKFISKRTSIQYWQNREKNYCNKTEKEPLQQVKSRMLKYFGHVMRQPHDTIESHWKQCAERTRWRSQKTWMTKNMLARQQYHHVTWAGLGDRLLWVAQDRDHWRLLTCSCSKPWPSDDGALTCLDHAITQY